MSCEGFLRVLHFNFRSSANLGLNMRIFLPGWLTLIILTFVTTWLLQSLEKDPTTTTFIDAPQLPDYMLEKFKTTRMDEQGQMKSQLAAASMVHYRDKNTEIIAPYLTFYKQGQLLWVIQAEQGQISPDGNEVRLLGQTILWRKDISEAKQAEITSRDVRVRLDTNYAETQASTSIRGYNSETRSVGMHVFLSSHQVELLSQVRGRYVPNTP